MKKEKYLLEEPTWGSSTFPCWPPPRTVLAGALGAYDSAEIEQRLDAAKGAFASVPFDETIAWTLRKAGTADKLHAAVELVRHPVCLKFGELELDASRL